MRRSLAVALAALGMALAADAFAKRLPDGKWWKRPRIAKYIGLTTEQDRQLDEIFNKARPRLIDLRAEMEKKNFAFDQAIEDKSTSREELARRLGEREEARAKLQKEIGLMIVDTRRVLTDPQWERLMEIRDRLEEARRRRQGNRREPRSRGTPEAPDDRF